MKPLAIFLNRGKVTRYSLIGKEVNDSNLNFLFIRTTVSLLPQPCDIRLSLQNQKKRHFSSFKNVNKNLDLISSPTGLELKNDKFPIIFLDAEKDKLKILQECKNKSGIYM